MNKNRPDDPISRWEAFGRAGLVVTVSYGPSEVVADKADNPLWMVGLKHTVTGLKSAELYEAASFEEALEIAETEAGALLMAADTLGRAGFPT